MLTMQIWRRHTRQCPHRHKGRDFRKCNCPLWADGYVGGKRTQRVSLKTRDYVRAIKRAADLDTPGAPAYEPLDRAVNAFDQHCQDLEESTRRKYKNVLTKLKEFLAVKEIDTVSEVTTEDLDAFRSTRKLSPVTSLKELQTLRQFFGFCFDRR